MLILDSPSFDPHFNIAAEEYLLKEKEEDYAFFYINDPSIIIGKHQNTWAEVNIPWTREQGIPVVRRMSGGGTVWHDRGNLNFSFILTGEEGKLVNFREYAAPVLEFLKSLNIPAEFGKRNEILVEGQKISGNAEHVHRNRVLHHGTLLYSSDLTQLKNALETDPDLYQDKAVQSVRSQTVNIIEFLEKPIPVTEFRKLLIDWVSGYFKESGKNVLTLVDLQKINQLVAEKYSLWRWNIGYSPRYRVERKITLGGKSIVAELEVEKGQIKKCSLIEHSNEKTERIPEEEIFLQGEARNLEDLAIHLIGVNHDTDSIFNLISTRKLVQPEWIDNFVNGLF